MSGGSADDLRRISEGSPRPVRRLPATCRWFVAGSLEPAAGEAIRDKASAGSGDPGPTSRKPRLSAGDGAETRAEGENQGWRAGVWVKCDIETLESCIVRDEMGFARVEAGFAPVKAGFARVECAIAALESCNARDRIADSSTRLVNSCPRVANS